MKKTTFLSTLFGILIMMQGCIHLGTSPTTLSISVSASKTTAPIAVHFFELETDEVFKKLDYFELVKKKQHTKDRSIVSRSKKILLPTEIEKRNIILDARIKYYAVIVGFKDIDKNDNWRFIKKLIPNTQNEISIILTQDKMIQVQDK
jgi:type VI secretion system VasD/TssJ family lipoprotein